MAAPAELLNLKTAPTSIRFEGGITINTFVPTARDLSRGGALPNLDENDALIRYTAAEASRELDSLPTRRSVIENIPNPIV